MAPPYQGTRGALGPGTGVNVHSVTPGYCGGAADGETGASILSDCPAGRPGGCGRPWNHKVSLAQPRWFPALCCAVMLSGESLHGTAQSGSWGPGAGAGRCGLEAGLGLCPGPQRLLPEKRSDRPCGSPPRCWCRSTMGNRLRDAESPAHGDGAGLELELAFQPLGPCPTEGLGSSLQHRGQTPGPASCAH